MPGKITAQVVGLYELPGGAVSGAFAFPTAVALNGGRLLDVNSQLDKLGGHPRLPFTVAAAATQEMR